CPVAPEPPGAAAGFAPGLWHAVLVLLAGRGAVFGEVHRDPTRVGGAESFGEVDAGAGEGVPAPLFGVRVRDDVGPSLREPLPEESAVVGGVQWRGEQHMDVRGAAVVGAGAGLAVAAFPGWSVLELQLPHAREVFPECAPVAFPQRLEMFLDFPAGRGDP